jgi:hypothetical protein
MPSKFIPRGCKNNVTTNNFMFAFFGVKLNKFQFVL